MELHLKQHLFDEPFDLVLAGELCIKLVVILVMRAYSRLGFRELVELMN